MKTIKQALQLDEVNAEARRIFNSLQKKINKEKI